MTLRIDVAKVYAVLLPDGWHNVVDDSFELEAYEYIREPSRAGGHVDIRLGGGAGESGVPTTGFMFMERVAETAKLTGGNVWIKGPITAVLAVREKISSTSGLDEAAKVRKRANEAAQKRERDHIAAEIPEHESEGQALTEASQTDD